MPKGESSHKMIDHKERKTSSETKKLLKKCKENAFKQGRILAKILGYPFKTFTKLVSMCIEEDPIIITPAKRVLDETELGTIVSVEFFTDLDPSGLLEKDDKNDIPRLKEPERIKKLLQDVRQIVETGAILADTAYTAILLVFYLKKNKYALSDRLIEAEEAFHKQSHSDTKETTSTKEATADINTALEISKEAISTITECASLDAAYKDLVQIVLSSLFMRSRKDTCTKNTVAFYSAVLTDIKKIIEKELEEVLEIILKADESIVESTETKNTKELERPKEDMFHSIKPELESLSTLFDELEKECKRENIITLEKIEETITYTTILTLCEYTDKEIRDKTGYPRATNK